MNKYRVYLWREDTVSRAIFVTANNTDAAHDMAVAKSGRSDWDSSVITKLN